MASPSDVLLGTDPAAPLPPQVGTTDVWFTTQVTTFNKKGNATSFVASPPQPLGLTGYTSGLDLAPRSLDVEQELRVGALVVPDDAVEGYVLTSDADGVASWKAAAEVAINAIGSEEVLDESLTSADLAADSVAAAEIAAGAVGSAELAAGAVTADKLAPASVGFSALAPGSVGGDQLLTGSVISSKIAVGAVGSAAISSGAVNSSELASQAVTATKIAPASVTSSHIQSGAVGATDIATGAIGTSQLAADAVTGDKIANDAITGSHIANNAIGTPQIVNGAVTGAKIAANTIQAADIASNAVGAAELADDAVAGGEVVDFGLTGADISTTSGQIYHGQGAGTVGNVEWMRLQVEDLSELGTGDAFDIDILDTAAPNFQFIELNRGGDTEFRLDADGDAFCDGSWNGGGADYADLIRVVPRADSVEPGDVLVLRPGGQRAVSLATAAYSPLVAGVHSTRPAFVGWGDREQDLPPTDGGLSALAPGRTAERVPLDIGRTGEMFDEIPLALVGIVPCKVTAANAPIRTGDLLVTSWTPGHAMRDDSPRPGTVLGKAIGELHHGTGVIDVLLMLR